MKNNIELLKSLVLDRDKVAEFDHAIAGVLYYKIKDAEATYIFPVDMNDREDVGTATFDAKIRAATLMRYIRKAINSKELIVY